MIGVMFAVATILTVVLLSVLVYALVAEAIWQWSKKK